MRLAVLLALILSGLQILVFTLLGIPFALVLGLIFLGLSAVVGLRSSLPEGDRMKPEKQLFGYSILYLFILFAMLVVDRFAMQGFSALGS